MEPHKTSRKTLQKKTITGAIAFFCFASAVFLIWAREQIHRNTNQHIDKQLLVVAQSIPLILPEDYHVRAKHPDAVSDQEYSKIEAALTTLAKNSGAEYVWTDILQDDTVYLTTCNKTPKAHDPDTRIHYFMPYKQGVSEAEMRAFASDIPVYATFEDSWGKFRAVFIPVTSPDGSRYLACAEFTVDYVETVLQKSNIIFIAGLFIFLIGVAPFCFLYVIHTKNNRILLETKNTELQQSQNNLQATLQSIGDGVIVTDEHGIITHLNPAAEKISGWKNKDAVGQPHDTVLHFISTRDKNDLANQLDELLSLKKTTATNRNISLEIQDDQIIEVSCSIAPIFGENSVLLGVILVLRDVTERNRLEEKLNASRKMEAIGELAGGIAHDFNNMLGGIIGASELLAFQLPDDVQVKQLNKIILDSAVRAADLTRKLLAFSRKSTKISSVVSLHKIISETTLLLQSTIDKRITLKTRLDAEHNNLLGDPSLLQNAILNICINAAHAMQNQGTLHITTQTVSIDASYCSSSLFNINPGRFIKLEIQDTGCGIPRENLNRIFEPFFTTKEQGKGTGLGLASVYGTVTQHDGAVSVDSEVGKGTSFKLLFPLTEEKVIFRQEDGIEYGSGTVLVVEDEPTMRYTAKSTLEKLGYTVITAENGQNAIEIFIARKEEIDLVLLDMIMPVMNGRDCFRKLKKISPELKIILASGFSRKSDFQELTDKGLSGFIRKPYLTAEFSRIIHRTLHSPPPDSRNEEPCK